MSHSTPRFRMLILAFCFLWGSGLHAQDASLMGHWPLHDSGQSLVGEIPHSEVHQVEFGLAGTNQDSRKAAKFDGQRSVIHIPESSSLRPGSDTFSVALWVHVGDNSQDVLGDLVHQYDSQTRTGWQLGIYSHGGVTNAQSNSRQLHFGIDDGGSPGEIFDHGRLGHAVYVMSLCVCQGHLYASTCEPEQGHAGHVYRYVEGKTWQDLGSPDSANAVSAMAVFRGELYVATSKYRTAGSALSESDNPHPGGHVYRLGTEDRWVSCGRLSEETEAVGSLVVFDGKLYAGSLYRPAGFFCYGGDQTWTALATPEGKRVEAMTVYHGGLFASCYDEGGVFRWNGSEWTRVGTIPGATQTYGFAVHRGELYVSEWPQAHVYRYLGGTEWQDTGRLGGELETMPLLVYNGKMYGGTLPNAEIYRYDGDHAWTRIAQVDDTPNVKYRRAWSMAVYQGRLFVGTLPSGHVKSIEIGRNATWDQEFPPGWHHIAAVRGQDRLQLYVDGKRVGQSATLIPGQFNLNSASKLTIGSGSQDHFQGAIRDLRWYRGALSEEQIQSLSQAK